MNSQDQNLYLHADLYRKTSPPEWRSHLFIIKKCDEKLISI